MRWRAYGLPRFLGELAVVMVAVAVVFFLLIPLFRMRLSYRWRDVPACVGFGAFLGLITQLFPKSVALRGGVFFYGSGHDRVGYWPIKRCRVISVTPVRGVLRMEVEVPVRGDKPDGETTRIEVLARPKHAESIRRAFEAGGATVSMEARETSRRSATTIEGTKERR